MRQARVLSALCWWKRTPSTVKARFWRWEKWTTGQRLKCSSKHGEHTIIIYSTMDAAQHVLDAIGYRVELGRVEAVVRNLSGIDAVVALGWPNGRGADGIQLFLEAETFDTELL